MNWNTATLSVAFFLTAIKSSDACMCMPEHPQTAFCKSNFAMKATVISDRIVKRIKGSEILKKLGYPEPMFVHYDVEVTRVYKGFTKIANTTTSGQETFKVSVHTSQSGAQCGVSLTKGSKYLIMGTIIGGRLQINHCNYVKEFHHLTKEIKHGLHGNYDCSCHVNACIDGYCEVEGGCPWHLLNWNEQEDVCTEKHRFCRKQQRTITNESKPKCEWSIETTNYKQCKKLTMKNSSLP